MSKPWDSIVDKLPHSPGSAGIAAVPPAAIADSPLLADAYSLAEGSHRSQYRATDGRPFLDHVVEVAMLLHTAGFDEDLIAAGLLHDAVERGTLTEEALRSEMAEEICTLVLTLTEDATRSSRSISARRRFASRSPRPAAGR